MSSALPAIPTAARSMLEEMLVSLRSRDEKPNDDPPALPARPMLRRRPPSSRNSLPTKLKIGSSTAECSQKDPDAMEEKASPDLREFSNGNLVEDRLGEKKASPDLREFSNGNRVEDRLREEKASPDLREFSNGNLVEDRLGKVDHPEAEELEEVPENSVASQSCLAGPVDEELGSGGCNDCVEDEASNEDYHKVHLSRLEELEELAFDIKAELRQKEDENVAVLQQVQQCEKKCSLCEEKMKSMEEMYQKEIETLKMSLAAVQKSLAAKETVKQPGNFDTEGAMPAEVQAPEGTPTRHPVPDAGLSRDADVVRRLKREFEQQKQAFEDDAHVLAEVKSVQSGSVTKSIEELRKLKVHYAAWKKEYKVRLHDTKAALLKLGKSEGKKPCRRWWCKIKRRNRTSP